MDDYIDLTATVGHILSLTHSLRISDLWKHRKHWQYKDSYLFVLLLDVPIVLKLILMSVFSKVLGTVAESRCWVEVKSASASTRECLDYCSTTILSKKKWCLKQLFVVQRMCKDIFLNIYTHLYPSYNAFLTAFLYQLCDSCFNISCIFKDGLPDFSTVGFVCIHYTSLSFPPASSCILLDVLPI